MQQLGLEAQKRRVISLCPRWAFIRKSARDPVAKSRRRRRNRRTVTRKESAEAQEYVSARPLTSFWEQNTEAEDEKNMEELRFVPSWALHIKCGAKSVKFLDIAAIVS